MTRVNMLEAKTHLSRLVESIESGAESEIVIARNGKPAARLVPVQEKPKKRRLGLANGMYPVMSQEEFDADNEEIRALFEDGAILPEKAG